MTYIWGGREWEHSPYGLHYKLGAWNGQLFPGGRNVL